MVGGKLIDYVDRYSSRVAVGIKQVNLYYWIILQINYELWAQQDNLIRRIKKLLIIIIITTFGG